MYTVPDVAGIMAAEAGLAASIWHWRTSWRNARRVIRALETDARARAASRLTDSERTVLARIGRRPYTPAIHGHAHRLADELRHEFPATGDTELARILLHVRAFSFTHAERGANTLQITALYGLTAHELTELDRLPGDEVHR